MKRIIAPLLVGISLLALLGAASLTETRTIESVGSVNRIELAWVSHTDGTVTLSTNSAISGTILRVTTNPASPAPTDNYDVTVTDADGIDVLANQGQNRDTVNSETFVPAVSFTDGTTSGLAPIVVAGRLTLNITNAGSGKAGSVILYVR